ncbi:DUF1441 family protein [Scandinavium goeteborgense]|uniref:DUF1441 family protein n=1 Tax=Scandinavium goeteborgense TaxID=1851514 RepID=UPI000F6807CC|nr:DUF1441 family protein [Scandinavium goeteborgense]QKN80784.1 DUF1441 family protein [Scandinavium goeteborgense]
MDQELKSLKFNVTQLAALSGAHRQTVNNRLNNVAPSGGNGSNLTLYSLTDILAEFMRLPAPVSGEDMNPQDRKAWYQSERERLKFELETAQLIPASDVRREFSSMAKAVVQVLETLPDILERDCALPPTAVVRVQTIIDDLRDQIAQRVVDTDSVNEEEELQEM